MSKSDLIFHPKYRSEIWRFYTYQFLHAGFPHIFGNVLMQLFLGRFKIKNSQNYYNKIGIPLEMVHGSIRMGLIYTVGVIMGSLTVGIVDNRNLLLGCSGGGKGLTHKNRIFFKHFFFRIFRFLFDQKFETFCKRLLFNFCICCKYYNQL